MENQIAYMNEKPRLNDPLIEPTLEVLRQELLDAFDAYQGFIRLIADDGVGLTIEWRYYRDGGAWLAKVIKAKKTVCWVSVWEGYFKVVFYFTEKTGVGIPDLPIDPEVKRAYADAAGIGKLFPLIFQIKSIEQLTSLSHAIRYKLSQK